MPDYKKTEELFEEMGISHLYKRPQAQLDDDLFYAKVTNPHTKTFFQIEDLPLEYRQKQGKQILSHKRGQSNSQSKKDGWNRVVEK